MNTKIPEPYNTIFKVITDFEEGTEEVTDFYKVGEQIEGYDCHLIAYLEPINEDEDFCYPILTDDKDFPVVELVGGRLYPVQIRTL